MIKTSLTLVLVLLAFLHIQHAAAERPLSFALDPSAHILIQAYGNDEADKHPDTCQDYHLDKAMIRSFRGVIYLSLLLMLGDLLPRESLRLGAATW